MGRAVIGAESNRARDLEYYRKSNTTSNNEKAISILNELGVTVDASFIIPPDYDIEDFDNLADYARSLEAGFVLFMPLTPLPGTDLYEEVKDQLTTTDFELFDLTHMVLPTKLPLQKFYRELAYLYYRINKFLASKMVVNYDRSNIQKFLKLHRDLKNRHLHHQAP